MGKANRILVNERLLDFMYLRDAGKVRPDVVHFADDQLLEYITWLEEKLQKFELD